MIKALATNVCAPRTISASGAALRRGTTAFPMAITAQPLPPSAPYLNPPASV